MSDEEIEAWTSFQNASELALQSGDITMADLLQLRSISHLKTATYLLAYFIKEKKGPHTAYLQALEELNSPSKSATEAETVQTILSRAENHLVYLLAKNGGQRSHAIMQQEEYIAAAKLVLTRL